MFKRFNSNIIKDFTKSPNTIPKCIDCKNFIKNDQNNSTNTNGKCNVNGYFLSTGPVLFDAESCRKNDLYCGPNAKFFKNK